MIKRVAAIAIGVLAVPVVWILAALILIPDASGYDSKECLRLQELVANDVLRSELINWVDNDLDLRSLDWSETERRSHIGYQRPGRRSILEPEFDFSLLQFNPDGDFYAPRVRLITPNLTPPEDGVGNVFANTTSVVFLQLTPVAVLVRSKNAEDFGVNPKHFKWMDDRVAVYCEPRE